MIAGILFTFFYLVALGVGVWLVYIAVQLLKADSGGSTIGLVLSKDNVSFTGLTSKSLLLVIGCIFILFPLYSLSPIISAVGSKDGVKRAILRLPPFAQAHILSGDELISTEVGQSTVDTFVVYPIAFSSTPIVIVQLNGEDRNIKIRHYDVGTTGFRMVLEKEGGFNGEQISVAWMIMERFSQW